MRGVASYYKLTSINVYSLSENVPCYIDSRANMSVEFHEKYRIHIQVCVRINWQQLLGKLNRPTIQTHFPKIYIANGFLTSITIRISLWSLRRSTYVSQIIDIVFSFRILSPFTKDQVSNGYLSVNTCQTDSNDYHPGESILIISFFCLWIFAAKD